MYNNLKTTDWERVANMTKDVQAEEMYAAYGTGKSLEKVAADFGVTRQSVFKAFDRRGWDRRPRPPARPTVAFDDRNYSIRNNGYYGCTSGDRSSLHRDVWRKSYGNIPDGMDVHHINGDRLDNQLENLHVIDKSDHTRLHHALMRGGDAEVAAVDIITAGYP